MTNDLKDKYLGHFYNFLGVLTTLQVVSLNLKGNFHRSLMKIGQKWLETVCRVVNSLKNQYKWPKLRLYLNGSQ